MTVFVVRVPPDTPPDAAVFLSGDGDPLGRWKADAVRLDRHDDGTFRGGIDPGTNARYLVTRGTWRTVEGTDAGTERLPRALPADGGEQNIDVAGWGRNALRYHPDFRAARLPSRRLVTVHLPPGYDLEPARRYPVFYLHDGQNLFDHATAFGGTAWGCDETADRLVRAGEVRPVILVGVGNTPERLDEYGPRRAVRRRPLSVAQRGEVRSDEHGPRKFLGDRSRAYGRFLVRELKPFIDATYRTVPGPAGTGVGGSSMGGLISLHLCRRHPDVFGLCGAMSPSLWWEKEHFLRLVRRKPGWLRGCRVWLDFGGREGPDERTMHAGLDRARRLAAAFRDLGRQEGRDFRFLEDPIGGHDEAAWGARFGEMLGFLFGAEGS